MAIIYRREINVSFHMLTDATGVAFSADLPWLQWMRLIDGMTSDQRRQIASNGDRYGSVHWDSLVDRSATRTTSAALLTVAKNRMVRPGQTDLGTGEVEELDPGAGYEVSERVIGTMFPGNILATARIGAASPTAGSLVDYINEKPRAGASDKIRALPIMRQEIADTLAQAGKRGVVWAEIQATVAGLGVAIENAQRPLFGLMGAYQRGGAMDSAHIRLEIRGDGSRKRSYDALEGPEVEQAVRMMQDVDLLVGGSGDVRARFRVVDDDGVGEVVLGEAHLAVSKNVPLPGDVHWVTEEMARTALRAAHDEQHGWLARNVTWARSIDG